jgi:hypothetical protein
VAPTPFLSCEASRILTKGVVPHQIMSLSFMGGLVGKVGVGSDEQSESFLTPVCLSSGLWMCVCVCLVGWLVAPRFDVCLCCVVVVVSRPSCSADCT